MRGRGRLDGNQRVRVGGDVLVAGRAVVVATGSGAVMPPGLEEARPWGNREATTKEPPESLVILGGGVVGVELAQAWVSLGTRVTVVEGQSRLISREEPFACEQVGTALREAGVDLRMGKKAVSVSRNGEMTVRLEDGTSASGAELLVAVGRRPATDGLGLETVGLEPGTAIEVGETYARSRTTGSMRSGTPTAARSSRT